MLGVKSYWNSGRKKMNNTTVVFPEEVYSKCNNTAGNLVWVGVHSGEHLVRVEPQFYKRRKTMRTLIEADKLIDNLDNMIPAADGSDYVMGIATAIQEVGRMAYEDYVEAIPVEWIEKWLLKKVFIWDATTMANEKDRLQAIENIKYGFETMLLDWEKEKNEKIALG